MEKKHLGENEPAFSSPPPHRIRRSTRLFLIALAVIVIISSGVGLYLLNKGFIINPIQFIYSPTNKNLSGTSGQRSEYLKDKPLASLYVSHMSLDDKIAQLLMV